HARRSFGRRSGRPRNVPCRLAGARCLPPVACSGPEIDPYCGAMSLPEMPTAAESLPGRATRMPVPERHFVKKTPLEPPSPQGMREALFAMGCFWGAERKFWETEGVYSTSVGYAAGYTPNPTYREVCSGLTG